MTKQLEVTIDGYKYVRESQTTACDVHGYMSYRTIPPTFIPYNSETKPKYLRIGNLEVYDRDIGVMTYVDAVQAAANIPCDGNVWRIPTLEELREVYKHKDGSFCTIASGSDYPQWYWSCTELRDHPSTVWNADFSDGYGGWGRKGNYRLSCRPVRSVS